MTGLTGRRGECDLLDRLIDAVRAGESRALVVRGEPGVGKTALLDYIVEQASGCRAQSAAGVHAAFLERAAMLTPEAGRRAQRLFAAARVERDAGVLDAALGLLVAVEAGPLDAVSTAGRTIRAAPRHTRTRIRIRLGPAVTAADLAALGANPFDLRYGMGCLAHAALMTNNEPYGTQVILRVRGLLAVVGGDITSITKTEEGCGPWTTL